MKYPEFIQKGDIIGISAPSAGVGRKLELYQESMNTLLSLGYCIQETDSVRENNLRSNTAKIRGEELNALYKDKDVKMVMCAAGGDFLSETLPYIDFKLMKRNPKWYMGASDPTSILYIYTTMCDVATIYGCNAGSYDMRPLPKYIKNNLEIIQGNLIEQKSFSRYMKTPAFLAEKIEFDTPVKWKSTKTKVKVKGRCIGGCIDVLKDLIGTEFDHTKNFINRYQQDGFIWYFDNFSLSAEVFYRTLLQMHYAGWFKHAKAILVGRTLFESSETGMTYSEAIDRLQEYIPVPFVYQADIGHTMPSMTLINGAIMKLEYEKGKGKIQFLLKD